MFGRPRQPLVCILRDSLSYAILFMATLNLSAYAIMGTRSTTTEDLQGHSVSGKLMWYTNFDVTFQPVSDPHKVKVSITVKQGEQITTFPAPHTEHGPLIEGPMSLTFQLRDHHDHILLTGVDNNTVEVARPSTQVTWTLLVSADNVQEEFIFSVGPTLPHSPDQPSAQ